MFPVIHPVRKSVMKILFIRANFWQRNGGKRINSRRRFHSFAPFVCQHSAAAAPRWGIILFTNNWVVEVVALRQLARVERARFGRMLPIPQVGCAAAHGAAPRSARSATVVRQQHNPSDLSFVPSTAKEF